MKRALLRGIFAGALFLGIESLACPDQQMIQFRENNYFAQSAQPEQKAAQKPMQNSDKSGRQPLSEFENSNKDFNLLRSYSVNNLNISVSLRHLASIKEVIAGISFKNHAGFLKGVKELELKIADKKERGEYGQIDSIDFFFKDTTNKERKIHDVYSISAPFPEAINRDIKNIYRIILDWAQNLSENPEQDISQDSKSLSVLEVKLEDIYKFLYKKYPIEYSESNLK